MVLFGEGKKLVERISCGIDLTDPDHDSDSVHIEFNSGYIEENIALVGQDDVKQLLILFIQKKDERYSNLTWRHPNPIMVIAYRPYIECPPI